MNVNDETITNLTQLQDFLNGHRSWLFRGQRDPKWNLETTLERTTRRLGVDQSRYERAIYREYRRHAHSYLSRTPDEKNTLEWLALMQHYGAPTRLLDFTSSFWIAVHFAIEEAESDCVVWAINPESLAHNRGDLNVRLRDNIEKESNFEAVLCSDVPFYCNERLALQRGTFIFSLDIRTSFQDQFTLHQKEHRKLIIPKELFAEIRLRLQDMNCTSRLLFPDIGGYSRQYLNHICH